MNKLNVVGCIGVYDFTYNIDRDTIFGTFKLINSFDRKRIIDRHVANPNTYIVIRFRGGYELRRQHLVKVTNTILHFNKTTFEMLCEYKVIQGTYRHKDDYYDKQREIKLMTPKNNEVIKLRDSIVKILTSEVNTPQGVISRLISLLAQYKTDYKLLPYSQACGNCPKCSNVKIQITRHSDTECSNGGYGYFCMREFENVEGEHLKHECLYCGHMWATECKNAK